MSNPNYRGLPARVTDCALTLDDAARGLRGMPRGAGFLVRLPDDTVRPVVQIHRGPVLADGTPGGIASSTQTTYAITFEVGE